jgi:hypothetical protein
MMTVIGLNTRLRRAVKRSRAQLMPLASWTTAGSSAAKRGSNKTFA